MKLMINDIYFYLISGEIERRWKNKVKNHMCNGSNEVWIFESSSLVYIFTIINLTISKNKNLKHSLTNFVNSRTSSNWSSKLKKSEQVCKEGEPDPAPSQEIVEQTYNGMGVWVGFPPWHVITYVYIQRVLLVIQVQWRVYGDLPRVVFHTTWGQRAHGTQPGVNPPRPLVGPE